ncbi:MAG: hypothetical protein ACC700_17590 [Anaerolineales bacterium]
MDGLVEKARQGYEELERHIAISAFVISDKAVKALEEFQAVQYVERGSRSDLLSRYRRKLEIASNTISTVRLLAKKDLKVD